MKISYNWLKDYLECDLTPEAVAEALTSIGLEVDSLEQVEEIPGGLAGVIVAEVVECVEHPDSDHLHITKLNTGTPELLQVVCGARSVFYNMNNKHSYNDFHLLWFAMCYTNILLYLRLTKIL